MGIVHVISENDLRHWKSSGKRIRAVCTFHQANTRTLSIAPYHDDMDEDEAKLAGWGHCHNANCHVTVLVKEWNPRAAKRYTSEIVDAPPRIKVTTDQMREAEQWQRDEVAALHKVSPAMREALRSPRPLVYLAGRGIEGELFTLTEQLGVGYLPPASEWRRDPPALLRKWLDRIVFPFTTSDGETGYLGRALRFWQDGMDEQEHKNVIDAHNETVEEEYGKEDGYKHQVRRWEKTYRSGFFHADALKSGEHLTVTEGPFDALPLIAAGLSDVVSVAGTHIGVGAIPTNIWRVTIAFDSDTCGKDATSKLQKMLARKGLETILVTPPDDGRGKDWSERYRRHGQEGLHPLVISSSASPNEVSSPVDELSTDEGCTDDEPHIEVEEALCGDCLEQLDIDTVAKKNLDGIMYCEQHWQERKQRMEEQPSTQADYWERTRQKLARQGYYEQVERENAQLLQRVQQTV